VRKDGVSKVMGAEVFASDVSLPGMLHARILKSPHPHARIRRIDTSKAEAAGAICITYKDVPKIVYNERLVSVWNATYRDRVVLPDKALYIGEPIAAVAAESEWEAQRALELIEVEYEPLEPLLDPVEAMKPGKPLIHERIFLGDEEVRVRNNIACEYEMSEGDVDAAFRGADVVIEREFRTNRCYHTQLECKVAVCRPEPDGGVTIWTTTQSIHNVRILVHQIFGIPMSKINVKKVSLGGSFGSSIQTNTVVPICVAIALRARRPVKLAMTREEDARDHHSFEMKYRVKLGAKRDGRLVAGEMEVIVDTGAHQVQPLSLLGVMLGWWLSLYKLPSFRYKAVAVYTNKTPACAMRGFGNPQVNWVVESLMDELAEALNMDPVELRLRNYVGVGDTFWGQGPTVKSVIKSCGVEEIMRRGSELISWGEREKLREQRGRVRRGLGMARGFHTSSAAASVPGVIVDYSGATVKVNEDGTVDYITGMMDCGEGTLEAHAKIVAEELGVPLGNVNVVSADTQTSVYDVCTHASRGVFAGGGAALFVARAAKEKLLEFASRILGTYPHALRIAPDDELKQGVIYDADMPSRRITVGEVVRIAREKNWGTVAHTASLRQASCPPSFTAFFVEVEVDTETGQVRPRRVVVGADIGTVVNPDLAAGQIHGGFAMGLSMALLEDVAYGAEGELGSRGYLVDYRIPTAVDLVPTGDFQVFFVETYEPAGPFGAKGLGEAAVNPAMAAVLNAVHNAIGVRFYELPVTPEKVLRALRGVSG